MPPSPSPSPPMVNFQPSCQNPDHGWPRFTNPSALLNARPWASYFQQVYGEIPSDQSHYPICTYDFWVINKTAFDLAGIRDHRPVPTRIQPFFDDSKFKWTDGELFEKVTSWHCAYYAGFGIYHSDRPYAGSDTWIEVIHIRSGTGTTGENIGMWLSYARGSGIWFNTGKTRMFDTHTDAAQKLCGNPSKGDDETALCGRNAGLDSYTYRTSRPTPPSWQPQVVSTDGTVSTWGMVDLIEIVAPQLSGKYACGNERGGVSAGFRAGWHAVRECDCDNNHRTGWLNCRPPSSGLGTTGNNTVVRAMTVLV